MEYTPKTNNLGNQDYCGKWLEKVFIVYRLVGSCILFQVNTHGEVVMNSGSSPVAYLGTCRVRTFSWQLCIIVEVYWMQLAKSTKF